jgi:hypothetical protein
MNAIVYVVRTKGGGLEPVGVRAIPDDMFIIPVGNYTLPATNNRLRQE